MKGTWTALRAAYQAGADKNVREAPYALVVIGRVLRDRGELDGWRAAWQHAIDAGFEDADDLRDELSPPAEDQDAGEPAEVPALFDPRNMARTGIAVLEHGLPALPGELTHRMAVPMAYWTARATAAVLFLHFHRDRRTWDPWATMATFTRHDGQWRADTHWHGTTFHDPFTDPGGLDSLGGEAIVRSGSSSGDGGTILHGIAAPAVKYLALIQDGHEDRRPLNSHFGAWIVRTDKPGPFRVTALDENGSTLDEVQQATRPAFSRDRPDPGPRPRRSGGLGR